MDYLISAVSLYWGGGGAWLSVGGVTVPASQTLRNLAATMGSTMRMDVHTRSVKCAIYTPILRSIKKIRHILDLDTCNKAVLWLVLSRLDYCNVPLVGKAAASLHDLQVYPKLCCHSHHWTGHAWPHHASPARTPLVACLPVCQIQSAEHPASDPQQWGCASVSSPSGGQACGGEDPVVEWYSAAHCTRHKPIRYRRPMLFRGCPKLLGPPARGLARGHFTCYF